MADSFGHFDNDFEKLSSVVDDEELVSSSTGVSHQFGFEGIEDLEPPQPEHKIDPAPVDDPVASGDATEFDQLIDFGEAPKPVVEAHATKHAVPTEVAPSAPAPSAPATVETTNPPVIAQCCSWTKNVDSRVIDLLYWRDIKKTGVLFGTSLSLLLSLALFSIISVVAYLSLIVLTITVSFRLYKTAMGTVQKCGDEHPFKTYLESDLVLPNNRVHEYADIVVKHATDWFNNMRRLILIEDVVDSLKFALFLWLLTYIGSWFNGMTLIILADVGLFTLPKVYDTYRVQINQQLDVVNGKLQDVQKIVHEKVPFLFKPKQA